MFSNKVIIIIVILVIAVLVVGLGFWLYQTSKKPEQVPEEIPKQGEQGDKEEEKDEVLTILQEVESATGIDFSEIKELEFSWYVEIENEIQELIVRGIGFKANIVSSYIGNIDSFFKDNGFEIDANNEFGYQKIDIVCTVGAVGGLEIKCARLTEDTVRFANPID